MSLDSVAKWFSGREKRPRERKMTVNCIQVESLESRQLLTQLMGLSIDSSPDTAALIAPLAATSSPTLGQKMGTFLQSKLNTRVGGGECAHIATEALRIAGADFTRTEPSGTTDYVWTTNRITRITQGSQVVGKRFQVGDIVQFQNAKFAAGSNRTTIAHHTQVVAAVDTNGRITKVYEQNTNGVRTVQLHTATDLSKLTSGSATIYRPVARVPQTGKVECTIVNKTSASRTCTMQIGSSSFSINLTKVNTTASFVSRSATFSGTARPTLKIGSTSVQIQDGAAYEIYTMSNGQPGIRKSV